MLRRATENSWKERTRVVVASTLLAFDQKPEAQPSLKLSQLGRFPSLRREPAL